LATALIAAPGPDAGLFLTNFPARGWLSYESLRERREDLIMVALAGNPDGSSEVDYTVNPATGFPWSTGPRNLTEPLNSVLPAWDVAMGTLSAVGMLAAERRRSRGAGGELISLALSDVAFAMVGNLGRIAEVTLGGRDHSKDGNYLYGAYGHDFETRDGRRVMVVALTARQWRALVEITGILRPWFEARDLAEIRAAFEGTGVSWGPYQTFRQLVEEDPRVSPDNKMFEAVEQPGIGTYLAPRSPLHFAHADNLPAEPAPLLGADTEAVLAEVLGLSTHEIGVLHDDGVVGGPS
jgi:2-methylfumaryl-CoA isomerase